MPAKISTIENFLPARSKKWKSGNVVANDYRNDCKRNDIQNSDYI